MPILPLPSEIPPMPSVPGLPLLRVLSGSHAHGTATPESDIDVRGVFAPSRKYILGFAHNVEQVEAKPDTVMYALRKFMALAANANPSILELLWTPEDCILDMHPLGRLLIDNRGLFLSRKVRWTYTGYAAQQLHRIRVHRRWLMDPPKAEPRRTDYGLPDGHALVSREQVGAFYVTLAHLLRDFVELGGLRSDVVETVKSEQFPGWEGVVQSAGIPSASVPAVQVLTGASDNFMAALQREQAYYRAVDEWSKYQTWKRTRNPKRAELEAKWGLDTKHLSHLVRLMETGEEVMRTGDLPVRRKDADRLHGVRNGVWIDGSPVKFEAVELYAAEMEARIAALYESPECPLPKVADRAALDALCAQITESTIGTEE